MQKDFQISSSHDRYNVVLDYVPERDAPVCTVTGTLNDCPAARPETYLDNLATGKTWTVQYAQSAVGSEVTVRCSDVQGNLADAPFNFAVHRFHD